MVASNSDGDTGSRESPNSGKWISESQFSRIFWEKIASSISLERTPIWSQNPPLKNLTHLPASFMTEMMEIFQILPVEGIF